jgi:hypothetical protein
MAVEPLTVGAGSSGLFPLYHIRADLSVVEVRLSVWRILDSSCGVHATSGVKGSSQHSACRYRERGRSLLVPSVSDVSPPTTPIAWRERLYGEVCFCGGEKK